jgi:hypothetical protein
MHVALNRRLSEEVSMPRRVFWMSAALVPAAVAAAV